MQGVAGWSGHGNNFYIAFRANSARVVLYMFMGSFIISDLYDFNEDVHTVLRLNPEVS